MLKGTSAITTAMRTGDVARISLGRTLWLRLNSIYTITIGAVDKAGRHAAFSESCTAVMASAYSGASGQKSIVSKRSGE